jgi:CheY-like chemotaxis protein
MSTISPLTLASHIPSKKPRMLVVDDEPDNLDLLYRTFRREFNVLRAESGLEALKVLANEGEVAVIISDQRMPEMKGTEFLSKTVPDFPDTVRIILTGFTDVEDLVEAINAGQVYRYITKPWDPEELRHVVERASETYDLIKQQGEALHLAERQSKLMVTVGQFAAQGVEPTELLKFLAEGFGQILKADACAFWLAKDGSAGCYGAVDGAVDGAVNGSAIAANELVQAAITERTARSALNIQTDELKANDALYAGLTQCHSVTPILYQGEVLGAISLQWNKAYATVGDVVQLLNVIAPQVALCLKAAEL